MELKDYLIEEKYVFYHGKEIVGADSKSFKILAWPYSKDKNSAYCCEKRLKCDIKTFKALDKNWAKDNHGTFL